MFCPQASGHWALQIKKKTQTYIYKKKQSKKYPLSIAILTGHFASTIIQFRICCEVHGFINSEKQLFTCYSKVMQYFKIRVILSLHLVSTADQKLTVSLLKINMRLISAFYIFHYPVTTTIRRSYLTSQHKSFKEKTATFSKVIFLQFQQINQLWHCSCFKQFKFKASILSQHAVGSVIQLKFTQTGDLWWKSQISAVSLTRLWTGDLWRSLV